MGRVVVSRRGLARGLGLLVAALTLVAVVPTGAHAASSSEFVAQINAARTARGGHALTVKADLNAAAQAQAERMADRSELYHNPNLGGSVSHWTALAENVGYGPDVDTIHDAFMNSAGHRANILNAKYTEVGVGVVVRDHVMWVAEVFRRPAGASSGSGSGSGSGGGSSSGSGGGSGASKGKPGGARQSTSQSPTPKATPVKKAKPAVKSAAPVATPVVVSATVQAAAVRALADAPPSSAASTLVIPQPTKDGSTGGMTPGAAVTLGLLALVVLGGAVRLRFS